MEEGVAPMESAAGQGNAHAMYALGGFHFTREEHVLAVEWFTKGAEAGLPGACPTSGPCWTL